MSAPDDGGAAFPTSEGYMDRGMTLRDWFAGQALTLVGHEMGRADERRYAHRAYAIADAMLAERAKAVQS